MNIICYIFFFIYFFSSTNQAESKSNDKRAIHENGSKNYVINGEQFETLKGAQDFDKKKDNNSKIKKPMGRPTQKPNNKKTTIKPKPKPKPTPTKPKPKPTPTKPKPKPTTTKPKPKPTTTRPKPTVTKPKPTQPPTTTATKPKPPTTTTTVSEEVKIANLKATYYKVTNDIRKKHKSPPLRINEELEEKAEQYARRYAQDKIERGEENYGINIAHTRHPNPTDVVEFWYESVESYDYSNPEWTGNTNRFISMVWRSATDIGCAVAHIDKDYYICCQYFRLGDVYDEEELKRNVESKLDDIEFVHENDAKKYVVNKKQFESLAPAKNYNERKNEILKIKRPTNRPINKKPIKKPNNKPKPPGLRPKPPGLRPKPPGLRPKPPGPRPKPPGPKPIPPGPRPKPPGPRPIPPGPKPKPTTTKPKPKPTTTKPKPKPTTTKPKPTQPPTTTTEVPEEVKIANLKATYYKVTNDLRERHKSLPLRISQDLEERAEEYARRYAEDKRFLWEDNYGINVVHTENPNPIDVVEFWYESVVNYDYSNPDYNSGADRFINMVWSSATQIGCAVVHTDEYYICCLYFRLGDIDNQEELRRNVLKP
uniref:SCP domain-containing protein n=1 Tax=Strongyloides stercoralis TaxID=6248 RepID=A0AAF5DM65_STRER